MEDRIFSNKVSFSIIMANYNNAEFIEVAIKSVIAQTYPNWELIIVDDGSTDDSIERITPFLNDKRIRLIRNENNLGVGATKKKGVANSLNDVMGILDSDDKLHESALKTMMEAYQKYPEFGFIYSTCWGCDSELKNCNIVKWIGPIIPEKTCIFSSRISQFRTFRRETYQKTTGYNPRLKAAVDRDIYYKMEEITRFKFINVPLYYIRGHGKGISQGKNKFQARVYHYIAKLNAYKRRLNTNLPNLTKKDLYLEYYKITFNKIVIFTRLFYKFFRISNIVEFLFDKLPWSPKNIKKKLEAFDDKLKRL